MHVQALNALGRFEAARTLALALIDDVARGERDSDSIVLLPRLRLANAEAGLGNLARAAELIDSCFERAGRYGNPLALGGMHRERAHVAALAGDVDTYNLHFAAMSEHFTATENPWLIQQINTLRMQAAELGMGRAAAPEGEPMADLDGSTAVETVSGHARSRSSHEAPTASAKLREVR
jgi:hypothetical protein